MQGEPAFFLNKPVNQRRGCFSVGSPPGESCYANMGGACKQFPASSHSPNPKGVVSHLWTKYDTYGVKDIVVFGVNCAVIHLTLYMEAGNTP